MVEAADVLPRESGSDVLRTRLHVDFDVVPEAHGGDIHATLVRLWAHAPGFDVVATNLPVELTGENTAATADIEWQLTHCDEADELDFVQLSLHISAEDGAGAARVQQTEVPARILMELGRMTGDLCGV
jgi:hypothetical protein